MQSLKKMLKKILSFFLLLVFAFAIVPSSFLHHHETEKITKHSFSSDENIDHHNEACKICKAFCSMVYDSVNGIYESNLSIYSFVFKQDKFALSSVSYLSPRNKAPPVKA